RADNAQPEVSIMTSEAAPTQARERTNPQVAIDPVCRMTVDPQHAAGSFEYDGQTYFFCSTHCLEKFRADPESFLKPQSETPITLRHTSPSQTIQSDHTCPMHPQII